MNAAAAIKKRFEKPDPHHNMGRRFRALQKASEWVVIILVLALAGTLQAAPSPSTGAADWSVTGLTLGLAHDLAWSPDGSLLAVAAEGGVGVYDRSLDETARLDVLLSDASRVVWSPDGKRVAVTGSDGIPFLWEVGDERSLSALEHRDEALAAFPLIFSPDGTQLAGIERSKTAPGVRALVVWDAEGGSISARYDPVSTGQVEQVYDLGWSADGLVALIRAAGAENTLLWYPEAALSVALSAPDSQVGGGRLSPDGALIAARLVDQRAVGIWERAGQTFPEAPTRVLESAPPGAINLFGQDRLLFGGADGRLAIFDLADGADAVVALTVSTSRVIDSAYNPADQMFTLLGQDGVIRLVDGDGSQMDALFAHVRVDHIGWNADLAHVTAWSADAIDGVSVTFDRATGRAVSGADQPLDVTQPLAYTRAGGAVAWTPNGGLAAWARTAEAGASAVFVRGETEPLLVLDGDATHAAWSPDGSMLAILDANRSPTVQVAVNVTHTGIGDLLSLTPPEGGDQVRAAAWSPEGARLAVASADGRVVSLDIYDFDTGTWTRLPELTGGVEAALDWRDDGLLYWSAVETSPLIIDPTTGTVIRDFDAYAGTVFDDLDRYGIVDWSADETLFAAIENGEPPRLSVINGEGAVVGDYAYGQLTTPAFRWSPAENALAAFDGGRVILVSP